MARPIREGEAKMKKLFGLLIFAFAFVFSASASAGSVSVYANPHNDAKYANGAGMSVGLDVTKNVDVSLNYLDTDARHGGKKIFDARVGMSAPIAGNLSGLAEVGYGSAHRADADVFPVALGLKYTMAEKLFLVGKGTRYFKDTDEQRVQWTVGLGLNF